MFKIKLFIILLLLAVLNFNTTAQNSGDNDPTFNPTDVGFGFGDGIYGSEVLATAIQSDGKLIIVGSFDAYNSIVRNNIVRINTDGSIDSSFNVGTGTNSLIRSIVIQSDGKIIIGGRFSTYNGLTANNIARLNDDGTLDTTFNSGSGANDDVYSIAIQSNGKILIGGLFESYNGTSVNYLTRLNINGSIDATFNQGTGIGLDPFYGVISISIQNDGKLIVAGAFLSYNGFPRASIVRINANGSIDTSFNPGTGASYPIYTTAIQDDGKIIIGGDFSSYNGITTNGIARINTDGSLDATFNIGSGAYGGVYASVIQSDGKIVIGGYFTSFNGTLANNITRLNTNGTLDTSFNIGTGAGNALKTIAIQIDEKIIIGGGFLTYNEKTTNKITRINTDGTLDTTFNLGTGANNHVNTTAIQNDGKIIIGGYFTSYNGTSINHIARLNSDGTLDATFNSGGTGANDNVFTTAIQSDGKIIIGGYFTSYNGANRRCITRLNADGTLDTTFITGTGAMNSVMTTAIQNDGKIIIGGYFTSYNGTSINRIARLNVDGTLDTTFNTGTGAMNSVMTTAIQNDGGIIIGGDFTSYNGISINRIARLNSDGTLDTTFNTGIGANSIVLTTAIQSDGGIIIGGYFTSYNGTSRNYIARLNIDGTIDTTFNSGTGLNFPAFNPIKIQNDGRIIIGGDFTSYNGISINRIARLNSDGTLDTTFNTGTGSNSTVSTISIQSDGKIIIGGQFTSYNGVGRNRIARILYDTLTGIENVTNHSVFNIYPNPTTAEFIIEFANYSPKTQLSIVSVEGKIVYSNNTINANKIVINAADWSKGIYMVKITDKQSSQVVKLVKQ